MQVSSNGGIIEGIDDGDGLAAAGTITLCDLVEPIRMANLGGRVTDRTGAHGRIGTPRGMAKDVGRVREPGKRQQRARFTGLQGGLNPAPTTDRRSPGMR